MDITSAELVLILRGKASKELRTRFLIESNDADSPTCKMLRATEDWGKTSLNSRCPSPEVSESAPTTSAHQKFRVLRRAGLAAPTNSTPAATLSDLVAFCRGAASPEISELVRQALEDPTSPLSLSLAEINRRSTDE